MPLQPALLGGLFIGVLSALPVVQLANCCCCPWIVGGGMLAAYLDQEPGRSNHPARGALDGLMAGVVGAVVFLMASAVIDSVTAPIRYGLIERMLEGPYDLPPDAREWFEMVRDRDDGGLLGAIFGFVVFLFAGLIFGTLGGLLGALFFWRNNVPPALGGAPQPPPIPPQL